MGEEEAWNDEEELIFRWFREGDLVYVGSGQLRVDSPATEIALAEHNGELIGANGLATLFATCAVCAWKGHTHFVVGDDEREMAYDTLEQAHTSQSRPCQSELNFKERSQWKG